MAFVDEILQVVPVAAEGFGCDFFEIVEVGYYLATVKDLAVVGLDVEDDVVNAGLMAFFEIPGNAVAVGEAHEVGFCADCDVDFGLSPVRAVGSSRER